jgi:hypothetical protein
MSWVWRCLDADGKQMRPQGVPTPTFGAQGDAETWLGETWRELADAGVDAVTLLEDGREVYGPMSLLDPAENGPA